MKIRPGKCIEFEGELLEFRLAFCLKHLSLDDARYHRSIHGSAMQYYGRLRLPMGTCDFWTPPHRNPLTDRYEILHN
jgi:hypothetical protein